jgi:SAM-dependent methyltransferase
LDWKIAMTQASAFTAAQYDEAYPRGIEHNFWHLARSHEVSVALRQTLSQLGLPKDSKVLEVGCGPGIVVAGLRAAGFNAYGIELANPEPLREAVPYITTGSSALSQPASFTQDIRLILLLDVIEHIENPTAFMRDLLGAYPQAKAILVTVPARPEVWSNYDTHFGHFRRYSPATLRQGLSQAGLTNLSMRPLFALLYAAALALTLLRRTRSLEQKAPKNLLLHRLLAYYFKLEARILRYLPFLPGLSLLAVGLRCSEAKR